MEVIVKNYFSLTDQKDAFFYFKKGHSFYDWILMRSPVIRLRHKKVQYLNSKKKLDEYCTASANGIIFYYKKEEFFLSV